VSEIERIPSMRKSAKQGVPRKPRHDMARPAAEPRSKKPAAPEKAELELAIKPESEPTSEAEVPAAPIETIPSRPEPVAAEPEPVAAEPEPVVPEPQGEPEPEAVAAEPEAEVAAVEPVPVAVEPEPVPVAAVPKPVATAAVAKPLATESAEHEPSPLTVRDMVRHVEDSWAGFRAAAGRFPLERMDEHLSEDGWTRKQMLAHIAAWHDLTADRLVKFMLGGKPVPLERDEDSFNASVARQAIGKTAGEVLKDMEMTFNRLRRQMQRLTDVQLRAADGWAAHVIGGNTFGHYAEHTADLYLPEAGAAARHR
jgi:hypothetical protein